MWVSPAGRAGNASHIRYLEAHIEQGQTLKAILRSASSPPSSVSGNTGSFSASKSRRHDAMAVRKDAGVAWHDSVDIDDRFQNCADRARFGPPVASRSISAPSIIPGRAEMLFRCATMTPA